MQELFLYDIILAKERELMKQKKVIFASILTMLVVCPLISADFPTNSQQKSLISSSLIDSVSSYSNNPYYNKNYPLSIPRVLTVSGTDLTSKDCQNTVSSLIYSYCSSHNVCQNVSESDINYIIMTQLANYKTADYTKCQGYILSEFKNYKNSASLKTNTNAFPISSSFPTNGVNTAIAGFPTSGGKESFNEDFPETYATSRSFAQKRSEIISDAAKYKNDTYSDMPSFKTTYREESQKSQIEYLKRICESTYSAYWPGTCADGEKPVFFEGNAEYAIKVYNQTKADGSMKLSFDTYMRYNNMESGDNYAFDWCRCVKNDGNPSSEQSKESNNGGNDGNENPGVNPSEKKTANVSFYYYVMLLRQGSLVGPDNKVTSKYKNKISYVENNTDGIFYIPEFTLSADQKDTLGVHGNLNDMGIGDGSLGHYCFNLNDRGNDNDILNIAIRNIGIVNNQNINTTDSSEGSDFFVHDGKLSDFRQLMSKHWGLVVGGLVIVAGVVVAIFVPPAGASMVVAGVSLSAVGAVAGVAVLGGVGIISFSQEHVSKMTEDELKKMYSSVPDNFYALLFADQGNEYAQGTPIRFDSRESARKFVKSLTNEINSIQSNKDFKASAGFGVKTGYDKNQRCRFDAYIITKYIIEPPSGEQAKLYYQINPQDIFRVYKYGSPSDN